MEIKPDVTRNKMAEWHVKASEGVSGTGDKVGRKMHQDGGGRKLSFIPYEEQIILQDEQQRGLCCLKHL
jgi:hypothetical protein